MNPILEMILDNRKGMYLHALEVEDSYELQSILESLVDGFSDKFSKEQIKDFIDTLKIYSLNDINSDEVYKTFQEFTVV